MTRPNHRVEYIDVLSHQAARRDALAVGLVPTDEPDEPMTLNEFLWTMFAILCVLILVLWLVTPSMVEVRP